MANKKFDFNKSLKDLNENDLNARIEEDKLRLKKLEFAHAISPLENPMSIRGLRKDIARLKTELKKRKLNTLIAGNMQNAETSKEVQQS